MNSSELVTPQHLARKAIIYIRQSSPHQMLSNQESLRLQYALEQRALNFGWRPEDIEIIDADLGLTGASAQHREGFKEVVSRVTLGQVTSRGGSSCTTAATAHKLTCIIYAMLKNQTEYRDPGEGHYEERARQRAIKNLERKAKKLGLKVVPSEA